MPALTRRAILPALGLPLLGVSLGGCVGYSNTDTSLAAPIALPPGQSAILIGIDLVNWRKTMFGQRISIRYTLIPLDNAGRKLPGGTSLHWIGGCALWGGNGCAADTHQLFIVPPGRYALEAIEVPTAARETYVLVNASRAVLTTTGVVSYVNLESGVRASPLTPVAELAVGEVIYPGDLKLDFTAPARMALTLVQRPQAARAALASSGLADRMLSRPWYCPSGPGPHELVDFRHLVGSPP